MMITKTAFIILLLTLTSAAVTEGSRSHMIEHPESYIEIPEWSVYSSWSGVGILHNLKIINNSDIEYKDVRIRIFYSTTSSSAPGTVVSQQNGVIPVTLPPRSTGIYLREGMTFGANSQFMNPVRMVILGASYNP